MLSYLRRTVGIPDAPPMHVTGGVLEPPPAEQEIVIRRLTARLAPAPVQELAPHSRHRGAPLRELLDTRLVRAELSRLGGLGSGRAHRSGRR